MSDNLFLAAQHPYATTVKKLNRFVAFGLSFKEFRYWRVSSQGANVQLGGLNSHKLIYIANGEAFLSANGSAKLVPPIAIGFRTQIDGCVDFEYTHARTIQITHFGTVTVRREKCI